jgi:hypothetical protein
MLLVTRRLPVGSLLAAGCTEPLPANPKAPLQDAAMYDGADGMDASDSNIISNPKGSWYDDDAYETATSLPDAATTDGPHERLA